MRFAALTGVLMTFALLSSSAAWAARSSDASQAADASRKAHQSYEKKRDALAEQRLGGAIEASSRKAAPGASAMLDAPIKTDDSPQAGDDSQTPSNR